MFYISGVVKLLTTNYLPLDFKCISDARNNSPLHLACERGRCDIIRFLLDRWPMHGIYLNDAKKQPLDLLLLAAPQCHRRKLMFVDVVWRLLVANPEAVDNFDKRMKQIRKTSE